MFILFQFKKINLKLNKGDRLGLVKQWLRKNYITKIDRRNILSHRWRTNSKKNLFHFST